MTKGPPPDKDFGKLVSAARGYSAMKRPEFAKALEKSIPTLERIERGLISSIGPPNSEKRRLLLDQIRRASEVPARLEFDPAPQVSDGHDGRDDVANLARAIELEREARKESEAALSRRIERLEQRVEQTGS